MSDFAAHLVDRVLSRCPLRQWVLTVPYANPTPYPDACERLAGDRGPDGSLAHP
jgi:hypothetical protein